MKHITFTGVSFNSRVDVIDPKLGQKKIRTYISCTNCDRKMKVNSKGKLEARISFLKAFSQNFEVLTPPSPSPRTSLVRSSTQKCIKKVQIGISYTNIDRKMKIKTKRYFELKYPLTKPFSQYF